jgi:hypothetical protein
MTDLHTLMVLGNAAAKIAEKDKEIERLRGALRAVEMLCRGEQTGAETAVIELVRGTLAGGQRERDADADDPQRLR